MSAVLLTAPQAEPLALAEAKDFLRVAHDDDDAVIAALIAAARGQIEAQTRCALITQTWRITLDAWPADRRVRPRLAPLRTLTAARIFDATGAAHVLDAGAFVLDRAAGTIVAPPAPPQPGRPAAGIELDVACGFGDAAGDVPELLRHALRILVAHWYDNRGLVAIGQSIAMMPATVGAMIAAFRVRSL